MHYLIEKNNNVYTYQILNDELMIENLVTEIPSVLNLGWTQDMLDTYNVLPEQTNYRHVQNAYVFGNPNGRYHDYYETWQSATELNMDPVGRQGDIVEGIYNTKKAFEFLEK